MWLTLGVPIAAVILGYVLKRIPNKKIQAIIGKFAYGLGVTITTTLQNYPWLGGLWNKTIEPYLIDLIDNTVNCFTTKFFEGLRSDK